MTRWQVLSSHAHPLSDLNGIKEENVSTLPCVWQKAMQTPLLVIWNNPLSGAKVFFLEDPQFLPLHSTTLTSSLSSCFFLYLLPGPSQAACLQLSALFPSTAQDVPPSTGACPDPPTLPPKLLCTHGHVWCCFPPQEQAPWGQRPFLIVFAPLAPSTVSGIYSALNKFLWNRTELFEKLISKKARWKLPICA